MTLERERDIQTRVWKHATTRGYRLFRNNVGVAITPAGVPITYGLCVGSADLIGWRPVTITEAHVGSVIAQFCAVELKRPRGRVSREQCAFLDAVAAAGGVAVVARGEEDIPE